MAQKILPGTGGEHYIPYEERTGEESVVYFTRDLSPEGLRKIYERVNEKIEGKIGIKLHTGEKNGPNIIPHTWVKELVEKDLPDAAIVETNTYYEGDPLYDRTAQRDFKGQWLDILPGGYPG